MSDEFKNFLWVYLGGMGGGVGIVNIILGNYYVGIIVIIISATHTITTFKELKK